MTGAPPSLVGTVHVTSAVVFVGTVAVAVSGGSGGLGKSISYSRSARIVSKLTEAVLEVFRGSFVTY